jgi:glycosyltransferase involved in cell wall biosynthesis
MVLIDMTWRHEKFGGFQYYSDQIIQLYKNTDNIEFLICKEDENQEFFKNIKNKILVDCNCPSKNIVIKKIWPYYFRIVTLSKLQKQLNIPFLYPTFPGHFIRYNKIGYINHDVCQVIYPELFSYGVNSYLFWNKYASFLSKRVDVLGTVSESSKNQISQYLKINKNNIFVTYNVLNEKLTIKNKYKKRNKLLFIGALVKRKNIIKLIKIAQYIDENNLNYTLCIVGRNTEHWNNLIRNKNIKSIVYKEKVSHEEKVKLIKESIYIYPTICEGFGIPALEALNLGSPVIAQELFIMKEVLGSAGIYLDFRKENFCQNIFNIINNIDEKYMNKFCKNREIQIENFTLEVFKKQFDKVLRELEK